MEIRPFLIFYKREGDAVRVEATNGLRFADLEEKHLEKATNLEKKLCELAMDLGLEPAPP